MGTRCLTVFKDDDGQEIAVLYRQFDGYPTGHGAELKEFLKGKTIVNGYTSKHAESGRYFNGMSCLAASTIAHFKKGIGNFYLYPAGTRDMWEEFIYEITQGEKGKIKVKVTPV